MKPTRIEAASPTHDKTLVVCLGPGGVGKTTTSANIATGIAQQGKKTVAIDFDVGLRNLDLVITCDSAPAHLAGALGVPVWVALAFAPDWRWMLDRGDSPWYPTMRLFRQNAPGDWEGVFERIQGALASLV